MKITYLTQKTNGRQLGDSHKLTGRYDSKGTYSFITPDEYNNHFVAAEKDLTTYIPGNLYEAL